MLLSCQGSPPVIDCPVACFLLSVLHTWRIYKLENSFSATDYIFFSVIQSSSLLEIKVKLREIKN